MKRIKEDDEISTRHVVRLAKKEAESLLASCSRLPLKDSVLHKSTFGDCTENISSGENITCSLESCDILAHTGLNSEIDYFSDSSNNSSKSNVDQRETLDTCFTQEIKDELVSWSNKYEIPHNALGELLTILKKYPIGKGLPKDPRTLKQTPRNSVVKSMGEGSYCHFGLEDGIKNTLKNNPKMFSNTEELSLKIGIDGLSISNSNTSQLWPILGCILPSNHVFVIGIYHGHKKPGDSNLFLQDFVKEITLLINENIVIEGKMWKLKLLCIISDAPAKSFILKTKGHNGFYSCTKCNQEGEYLNNRVCFPETSNFSLRSDENFLREMKNVKPNENSKGHNVGVSILCDIPDFRPVSDVPLEYMHLVCIGVVKKLICLWLNSRCYRVKLSSKEINKISHCLAEVKPYITCEFSRAPRDITTASQWKATEFRQFLLYTSPIVLKSLDDRKEMYDHFITLHVAMRILTNEQFLNTPLVDYADSLLKHFVESFIILYGIEYVSHNVHGLLHIVNDVKMYGTLDSYSAFPFENFMRVLKKKLKKNEKPLQQLHRRYVENGNDFFGHTEKTRNHEGTLLSISHQNGPLIAEDISCHQYKCYETSEWKLKVDFPNNCVMLIDESVVMVSNIIQQTDNNNNIFIIGRRCQIKDQLYNKPCLSSILKCFVVEKHVNHLDLVMWPVTSILTKCMTLPHDDHSLAVLPIQHCL